ncbi:MAG: ATPase [Treponema sp.]|nr:ATPase [Treponema sp.]
MIVPMKKVSLVVLDSEKKESLKALRKLGLVHLEQVEGSGPVLASFKESQAETEKAISILAEIKAPKKAQISVSLAYEQTRDKVKEVLSLSDRKKSLFDYINQNTQELARFSEWGEVKPEDFKFLAEKGLFAYMYEIPQEKYALIPETLRTMVVNTSLKITRFLLLSEVSLESRPQELPPEAYEVELPSEGTLQIAEGIKKAGEEIAQIEKELLASKKYEKAFAVYLKRLSSDIEFENVCTGMAHEEPSEDGSAKLAWLTGYVPNDSFAAFSECCRQNSWAYASSEPSADDPVPTKLKNNRLVSLIYPLTDFLGVNPGYNEFDISGWFLLFFCVFFAMIFADAGYGAIIAAAGLLIACKGKSTRTTGALVTVLGLSTCVWGILTCSWFGLPAEKLSASLVDLSFAPVSSAKNPKHYSKNQMEFCFMLALVQLTVAHLKCIFANRKSLKCLGDIGALMQLWGMFYVVFNMVVDGTRFPLSDTGNPIPIFGGAVILPSVTPLVCIAVLGIGFAMSFVFANYEGSVVKSILESLKNIISVLLGVVNVFSDTVSYIRLWAVGLAGAAICNTVNTMAGPMFGKMAMFVFAVILLVFGHGLNMVLNLLSVVVHGVRLNTLEFSQHLGMSWSGTKYSPFREHN